MNEFNTLSVSCIDVDSPFHEGEQSIQNHVGLRSKMEVIGQKFIRSYMPEQHRDFYCQLPFMVVAAKDQNNLPWLTLLCGDEGFIRSEDSTHLAFATLPFHGDALEHSFVEGAQIGMLGIESHSQRRNRVNGTIISTDTKSIAVHVDQSFGNCPQYIANRQYYWSDSKDEIKVTHHERLTQSMQQWIKNSNTFFIGSGYSTKVNNKKINGMDASHRGGIAGFIKIVSSNQLVFPDYSGNNFFNTIGNLIIDPKVALLFVDFMTGSMLQVTGKAQIDFDSKDIKKHAGAQRLIHVFIDEIKCLENILPLRWRENEQRFSLQLINKTKESNTITSFEFKAKNNSPLPMFSAGQYLPITVSIKGHTQLLTRNYSLSNASGNRCFRISVKREEGGIVSNYLHNNFDLGDEIIAGKPQGDFCLAPPYKDNLAPIVFISAGVGITPLMSMINTLANEHSQQTIYFIHASQHSLNQAFTQELAKLKRQLNQLTLVTFYSQPSAQDIKDHRFNYYGRIHKAALKEIVPSFEQATCYLCGSNAFTQDISDMLIELNVDEKNIHLESF
jgi:ferredoxin-NADP reductase/predicted pyridoxine 5'-phosphate oxidase superfamily flavin-nucleotide-binding protein